MIAKQKLHTFLEMNYGKLLRMGKDRNRKIFMLGVYAFNRGKETQAIREGCMQHEVIAKQRYC